MKHRRWLFPTNANWWGTGADGAYATPGMSGTVTIPSTLDGPMVVSNFTNLTVNFGDILTLSNRCRGWLIYCRGDCDISGVLAMSYRGANADPSSAIGPTYPHAVPSDGLKIRRFKNGETASNSDTDLLWGCGDVAVLSELKQPKIAGNGKVWTIQKVGANGGAPAPGDVAAGNPGDDGTTGQSGGGGSGGTNAYDCRSGQASAGTCFSGGCGTGGCIQIGARGPAAGLYGGPGGAAVSAQPWDPAGGGAGNPGGSGANGGANGGSGTGGTLILLVRGNLSITGSVLSHGIAGGANGGGASGGGNILILYGGSLTYTGTVAANGGPASSAGLGGSPGSKGGRGGNGSVQGPTKIDK